MGQGVKNKSIIKEIIEDGSDEASATKNTRAFDEIVSERKMKIA